MTTMMEMVSLAKAVETMASNEHDDYGAMIDAAPYDHA